MTDGFAAWVKLVAELGGTGVLAMFGFLLYRLIDKYGGAFLAAQNAQTQALSQQAAAVTSLAAVVREGQTDQREVLIAVRVQSAALEEMKSYLRDLSERMTAREA